MPMCSSQQLVSVINEVDELFIEGSGGGEGGYNWGVAVRPCLHNDFFLSGDQSFSRAKLNDPLDWVI